MLKLLPGLVTKAQDYVDAILRDKAQGKASDLFAYSHWLAFEVVFLLAFDRDPAMLSTGKPHEVMNLMFRSLPAAMYGEIFGIKNPFMVRAVPPTSSTNTIKGVHRAPECLGPSTNRTNVS